MPDAKGATNGSHNIDAVYCPHCNHVTLDPTDEFRAKMERPPCPVYADEDRPDFDPKHRRWWHLPAEEKANYEAEIARLRRQVERVEHAYEAEWQYATEHNVEVVTRSRLRVALDG